MQTPARESNEEGLDSHARFILLRKKKKKQIYQATWTHARSKKRLDRKKEAFRFRPYRAGDRVPGVQEHAMDAKAERGHLRLEWVRQTVARLVKNMEASIQEGTQSLHQQSQDRARQCRPRGTRLR